MDAIRIRVLIMAETSKAEGRMTPRGRPNALADELQGFIQSFQTLTCISRMAGDSREVLLAKRELLERDRRIEQLEVALKEQERAREGMIKEQAVLEKQLNDARGYPESETAMDVTRQALDFMPCLATQGGPGTRRRAR